MSYEVFKVDETTIHGRRAVENAAMLAHEANRAYCEAYDDHSQPDWEDAEAWQRDSAIAGVRLVLRDPAVSAERLHESWMKQKADDGWVYGEVKDPEKKTHPCMVAYKNLPAKDRFKDGIYGAVVREALYCYERRTMTNAAGKVPEYEMPYRATDPMKTYGLVQVVGRSLRIAGAASAGYLEAADYMVATEARRGQLADHLLYTFGAKNPEQAYDWWRAQQWPALYPDLPTYNQVIANPDPLSHGLSMRTRVHWYLIWYVAQTVFEIEGVDFKTQEQIAKERERGWTYSFAASDIAKQAEADITNAIAKNAASTILAKEDQHAVAVMTAGEPAKSE